MQDSRISEVLKCPGCVEESNGKLPPKMVIYCFDPDHEPQKPKASDLFREMKKYLKSMSPSIDEHTIVFSNLAFISSGLLSDTIPLIPKPVSKSKSS